MDELGFILKQEDAIKAYEAKVAQTVARARSWTCVSLGSHKEEPFEHSIATIKQRWECRWKLTRKGKILSTNELTPTQSLPYITESLPISKSAGRWAY